MLIDLSEVMSVPDKILQVEAESEQDCLILHGETCFFKKKNPLKLTVTNLGKKRVLVEGETDLILKIPCSRCLEAVSVPFEINYKREFDFGDEQSETLKETSYIDGYNLDTDLLIYEEVLLDFPMKVLCREDCKGICSNCGQNLNKRDCGCDRTSFDPRMSAIRDIFNNQKS